MQQSLIYRLLLNSVLINGRSNFPLFFFFFRMSFEDIEKELGSDVLNPDLSTPAYVNDESSSDSSDISMHPEGCRCPSCKELPPLPPLM